MHNLSSQNDAKINETNTKMEPTGEPKSSNMWKQLHAKIDADILHQHSRLPEVRSGIGGLGERGWLNSGEIGLTSAVI